LYLPVVSLVSYDGSVTSRLDCLRFEVVLRPALGVSLPAPADRSLGALPGLGILPHRGIVRDPCGGHWLRKIPAHRFRRPQRLVSDRRVSSPRRV